jgi:hypothetical protein
MAISNTSILIKRSQTTGKPGSLNQGELAYSYLSNTLFFGTVGGNGVVNVGGQYYTSTVDAATNANTVNTLVKRDAGGAFAGQLYGNANTATLLQNSQNFSVSGGDISASAVSFNGSSPVTLNASLNNVGPTGSGSVGSATSVPVIQYGANGRILSVSSASIQTSFSVSDGVHSNTVNGGSTLTFNGTNGITTSITPGTETVTVSTDNTIVRSNTAAVGIQTIGTDVQISGNLTVTGAVTYVNTSIIQSTGSIMHLAANNSVGDVIDIGFVGEYNNGSANLSTGLVRDAGSKNYYLFTNVASGSVTGNTIANNLFSTSNTATLYSNLVAAQANASSANITSASIGTLSLTNALPVTSGGTGVQTIPTGQVVIGAGTNAVNTLANVSLSNTGTYGLNSTIIGFTSDAWGRATSITYAPISGLTVPQGGTGQSTFATGQLIIGGGTGPMNALANSSYANTGTYGTNSTLASLSVDVYGRVTAASWQPISGLTVSQGGTGTSTFTTNGITYGNGTGAIQVTAAAGTSDQTWSNQILTVTNSGVPTWTTTMDGGTF